MKETFVKRNNLSIIFKELVFGDVLKTQKEFAEMLGLKGEGYLSNLLKSVEVTPIEIQRTLNRLFGIPFEWMEANDPELPIFAPTEPPLNDGKFEPKSTKKAHNIRKDNYQTTDETLRMENDELLSSLFTKKVEDMTDNEFIRYMYLRSEMRWDNLLAAHNTLVEKLPELRKEDWYKGAGGSAPQPRERSTRSKRVQD